MSETLTNILPGSPTGYYMLMDNRDMLKLRFKLMLDKLDPNPSPEGLIIQGLALLVDSLSTNKSFFDDVEDFHKKYGIQYDGQPRPITGDQLRFRMKRLDEEYVEYIDAVNKGDLAAQVDALIDLCYIAFGTIHLMGVDGNEAWRRVQIANMAKELSHPGNPGKYGKLGDKIDIVKPPGWQAPDHTDLVYPAIRKDRKHE